MKMWHPKNIFVIISCNMLLLLSLLLLPYAAADADDSTKESSEAAKVAVFKDIPNCNAQDNNFNDCLRQSFDYLIKRAKNGIPVINVPPLDPLTLNTTSISVSHPLIEGKVSARNTKLYGLSKSTAASADYKRKGDVATAKFKILLPELYVEGDYRAKVKFNGASLKSRGRFNLTLSKIDIDLDETYDLVKRSDGHLYMILKKFDMKPTIEGFKFYADGIFPDPLLNDAVLEFINQNWQPLYHNFIAETRTAWEPEIVKLFNEFFSHVPLDALITGE